MNEAIARIKINKLPEPAGWRFFADGTVPPISALNQISRSRRPISTPWATTSRKPPLVSSTSCSWTPRGFPTSSWKPSQRTRTRSPARSRPANTPAPQNCRFVILSNGNLQYFWDLERGNPYVITSFPTPESVSGYRKVEPNPQRLIEEQVGDDYIVLTHRPNYASEAAWRNEAERPGFIQTNKLCFLRAYQLRAIHALQRAVQDGSDRFLFEMATGTGKTLTAAAVIKLFLRSGNASRVLFLVDRLELEDQAHKVFTALLSADFPDGCL